MLSFLSSDNHSNNSSYNSSNSNSGENAATKQSSELNEWLNNFKNNGNSTTSTSTSSSSPSSSSSSTSFDPISFTANSVSSFFSNLSSSLSSSSSANSLILDPSQPNPSSSSSASNASQKYNYWPFENKPSTDETGLLIDVNSLPSPSSSSTSTPSYFSFQSLTNSTSPSSWLGLSGDNDPLLFGLTLHQRLILFFMALLSGLFFLFLSASFLPLVIVGMSAKFTMSYASANISFLLAACLLTGPSAQLTLAFQSSRWLITIAYLSSLFALIYVASSLPTFLLLAPILLLQIVSLFAYLASYIPFGLPVMQRLFGLFVTIAKRSC